MFRRFSFFLTRSTLVLAILILSGCGEPKVTPYSVNLEIWGVFDDSDALENLFSQYRELDPYVREITYRKLSPDTYKTDLLNALAAGTGPDIFMMRNSWQGAFGDKLVSAPPALISEKKFRDTFVDVVSDDFLTSEGKILAAPLSVDTLALYYNKDLFNAAGIAEPPKTWEELIGLVPKLTKIDTFGNINRSAISLGTGDNINRSTDVLLSLMLQMGANSSDTGFFGGTASNKAFKFYNQFSQLGSPNYTWSPRQHYSIDAFYEGSLGMTINYSYQYDVFRQKNAKLNFAVAPLPQFTGQAPVNFANYWGLAVAKNKTYEPSVYSSGNQAPLSNDAYQAVRVQEAWQFIQYLAFPHPGNTMTLTNALSQTTKDITLKNDPTAVYLEETKKPAARRDLLESQKDDAVLSSFVTGSLIGKSWKAGSNVEAAESLIVDAINAVNRGERNTDEALSVLYNRINQFH